MRSFLAILFFLMVVTSEANVDNEMYGYGYTYEKPGADQRGFSPHMYEPRGDTDGIHETEEDVFEFEHHEDMSSDTPQEWEYFQLDDEGMTTDNYQKFMVSEMADILMDAPLDIEDATQGRFLCIKCLKKYMVCKKICKGLALLSSSISDIVPCSTTCLQRLSACCFKGYGSGAFNQNKFQQEFSQNVNEENHPFVYGPGQNFQTNKNPFQHGSSPFQTGPQNFMNKLKNTFSAGSGINLFPQASQSLFQNLKAPFQQSSGSNVFQNIKNSFGQWSVPNLFQAGKNSFQQRPVSSFFQKRPITNPSLQASGWEVKGTEQATHGGDEGEITEPISNTINNTVYITEIVFSCESLSTISTSTADITTPAPVVTDYHLPSENTTLPTPTPVINTNYLPPSENTNLPSTPTSFQENADSSVTTLTPSDIF